MVRMLLLILLMGSLDIHLLLGQELNPPEKIQARWTGPFHLRLILQPLLAIILGIRDGRREAKIGNLPFFRSLMDSQNDRKIYIKQVGRAIAKPLVLGILLDMLVQYMIFQRVRIWGGVLFGALFIALPYSLILGLSNRYFRQKV